MNLRHLLLILFCFTASSPLLAANLKNLAGISFTAPDNWQEQTPSSSMRAFQFQIPGKNSQPAEMAVFFFGPGQGGDIQGNIERWKGQFARLDQQNTEEKNINGTKVTLVSLEGAYQQTMGPMMSAEGDPKEGYAVLGAIIEAPQGSVFFKLTGPKDTVLGARPEFDSLTASIQKSAS